LVRRDGSVKKWKGERVEEWKSESGDAAGGVREELYAEFTEDAEGTEKSGKLTVQS